MAPKLPIIKRGYHAGMDFQDERSISSSLLLYAFFAGAVLFFFVLVLRLFQLTVVKGEYYRRVAEGNRIREIIVEPKRGMIIDRKGIVLAQNSEADLDAPGTRLPSKRHYVDPEVIAPLIGYRQTADEKDIQADPCLTKITLGDKVGKKGVEKLYECELRGRNGKKLIEVDASGQPVKTLSVLAPEDGKRIELALDQKLQEKAYEHIKDKRAVVVGLKPQTGEVLVLSSSPTFNPQDFEDNKSEKITGYFTNKDKPLFNRATEGTYPPGSVFKIVVAAGALEDKTVDDAYQIEDTGKIKAGPIEFGNWYFLEHGKTDGMVNVTKALQRSNDIYFYRIGEKMGEGQIRAWSETFGFGKKTGIQLEESEGIIPSSFWKEEVLKEQWYLGDTYNLSIGQGYMLVTPVQVAQSTAVIASDGQLCTPQLLKTQEGTCKKINLSQKTIDLIKKGMIEACTAGGTGWPLFDFKVDGQLIPTACKTGTAESHMESGKPHAWFTVFAPAVNPEIVLTVLVEESGQGSDIAGPIAKEVLKAYFERKE